MKHGKTVLNINFSTSRVDDFANKIIGVFGFARIEAEIFEQKNVTLPEVFYGTFDIGARNIISEFYPSDELVEPVSDGFKRERFIFAFGTAEMRKEDDFGGAFLAQKF